MRADKRPQQQACDITIYSDKGSLALRFPKRHNAFWEQLDGKSLKGKPKCLGIGKYGYKDTPEDWKRATQLAIALETDLDHPEWEKLFDPTLAKYGLGNGKYAKLAEVLQLSNNIQLELEITVGEMWEAYLNWKKTVVEETTFKSLYAGKFSNFIKGRIWQNSRYEIESFPLSDLVLTSQSQIIACLDACRISQKTTLISALKEAFEYAREKLLLKHQTTQNPFLVATSKFAIRLQQTTQEKYAPKIVDGELREWYEIQDEKQLEEDRRAFTKEERDIIIKAFYEGSKTHALYAPLIEFYFLTGCRTSEAIALTWNDIDFDRRVIRFSKSLGASTRKIKETKTGEIRLFYFQSHSPLERLLLTKREETGNEKLIFPGKKQGYLQGSVLRDIWLGRSVKHQLASGIEKKYYYPGVVRCLADEGRISRYLPQYHTRHTYITLTAQANKQDTNALLYIASACGNSVDVILRHYLDIQENTQIMQV